MEIPDSDLSGCPQQSSARRDGRALNYVSGVEVFALRAYDLCLSLGTTSKLGVLSAFVELAVHVSNSSRSASTFFSSPVRLPAREGAELSDCDDVHQFIQPCVVLWVPGHQRQALRDRSRGDQQVGEAASRLAACGEDCCVDSTVRAGGITPEGDRLEGGFSALETILSTSALGSIRAGGWPSSQFRHRDGGDSNGERQLFRADEVQVDDHGRIQQTRSRALSHADRPSGRHPRPDPGGTVQRPLWGRHGTVQSLTANPPAVAGEAVGVRRPEPSSV